MKKITIIIILLGVCFSCNSPNEVLKNQDQVSFSIENHHYKMRWNSKPGNLNITDVFYQGYNNDELREQISNIWDRYKKDIRADMNLQYISLRYLNEYLINDSRSEMAETQKHLHFLLQSNNLDWDILHSTVNWIGVRDNALANSYRSDLLERIINHNLEMHQQMETTEFKRHIEATKKGIKRNKLHIQQLKTELII